MAKVLVVYFSRGGTTLRMAKAVADALGADLEPIAESTGRSGRLGYVRSLLEAVAKGLPSIRTSRDPRAYDLVVVGTPVWAGTLASPVRSYLFRHGASLPRVAFFATMGGRGAEQVLREMQLFCADERPPTCFATESEILAGGADEKVTVFVSELRELLEPAAQPALARSVA